jgi:hypothetical protein
MTKLSAEAYAIVEGRHSDPFHYLGLHTEDNKTVVRAFLPEASRVDAIDEYGEAAALARIHDDAVLGRISAATADTKQKTADFASGSDANAPSRSVLAFAGSA